jgi:hypothetical protein
LRFRAFKFLGHVVIYITNTRDVPDCLLPHPQGRL